MQTHFDSADGSGLEWGRNLTQGGIMGASSVVRPLRAVIVFGLVSAALFVVGAGRASATPCESWGGMPPDSGSGDNELLGVTATSACNAWAVGHYVNVNDSNQTL